MSIEPQFLPSPQRYWLDAPKEDPHTCFVKDSDYAELRAITTRLQLERDLHRNEASRLRKALEKIAHPEQGLRPQDKEPFLKGFVSLDRRIAMEALEPASSPETKSGEGYDANGSPVVPKGHFWRGLPEWNRHQCRNCGQHYTEHYHTDEASRCPL